MADLRCTIAGITSPNPFWLASAPPTDKAYNVNRAFEAGWGGVVWKTLGEDPPIVNVSSRYGAVSYNGQRMAGFNNIELITDRPLAVDLVEDTGCDGVELNFGCPHGMSERNMGSAVGQVPEYIEMVTRWCKQFTRMPVITKLTPNITDIRYPARAAKAGGADAVSLINTISSIMGVDLDRLVMSPAVDGKGSHGGYCGPAVKPIALNMVAEIARDPQTTGLPLSGIGGITTWRDAAEYIALGCGTVQVCTAAMVYGFKIVQDMVDGLSNYMDEHGHASIASFQGRAVPSVTDWQNLNLNYTEKAQIDQDLCIQCGRCHVVCEDTSHQAILATKNGVRHFEVVDAECVGCNLCTSVCPVPGCITMRQVPPGQVDARTGAPVSADYGPWTVHPNNPMRAAG